MEIAPVMLFIRHLSELLHIKKQVFISIAPYKCVLDCPNPGGSFSQYFSLCSAIKGSCQLFPDDKYLPILYGIILTHAGNVEEASSIFLKSIVAAPWTFSAWELVSMNVNASDLKRIIPSGKGLEYSLCSLLLAYIYAVQGNIPAAIQTVNTTLSINIMNISADYSIPLPSDVKKLNPVELCVCAFVLFRAGRLDVCVRCFGAVMTIAREKEEEEERERRKRHKEMRKGSEKSAPLSSTKATLLAQQMYSLPSTTLPCLFLDIYSTALYLIGDLKGLIELCAMIDEEGMCSFSAQIAKGNMCSLQQERQQLALVSKTSAEHYFLPPSIPFFDRACRLKPLSPEGWIHLGNEASDLSIRLRCFLRAVGMFPKDYKTMYCIGCVLCSLKEFRRAILWLKKALKQSSADTSVREQLAKAYLGIEMYEMAEKTLRDAIEDHKKSGTDYSHCLMMLYRCLGELDEHEKTNHIGEEIILALVRSREDVKIGSSSTTGGSVTEHDDGIHVKESLAFGTPLSPFLSPSIKTLLSGKHYERLMEYFDTSPKSLFLPSTIRFLMSRTNDDEYATIVLEVCERLLEGKISSISGQKLDIIVPAYIKTIPIEELKKGSQIREKVLELMSRVGM
ncbi:hypothetical protein ADUPG1_005938 [Aduncisulcus paluster]|uniref:Cdc23 domain-containing protein n=1 Tax=Aduncisulcus paluster TaxID=2918883 RepID=A0ABQ5KJ98_9EUKA|nr:hypothetical protein ADUPG1_005938 [Aduncisulcus paluster]